MCSNFIAVTHCQKGNWYADKHSAVFLHYGSAKEGMVRMNKCTDTTSVHCRLNFPFGLLVFSVTMAVMFLCIFYEVKKDYVGSSFVCAFVTEYYQLNCWIDFRDIQYSNSLQRVVKISSVIYFICQC